MLRKIFGTDALRWKGKYEIEWCDLCEVIIIQCPKCEATSCNCAACPECSADIDEFHALKMQPRYFLSEEENKAVEKYYRLRKWIVEDCLEKGHNDLNWERMYREGNFSKNDQDLFPEIKKLDDELKLWDYLRPKTE